MFLDNGCFSDKIWAWKLLLFSEKLEKKGILIDVLGRYYSVILTVLTFFWPNKVLKAGGLSWKFWKNNIGAQCFWENGRFFDKIWAKAVIFSWTSEKKGILLTFLAHNIMFFWQNWRFLDQIWAWQHGVFHEKKNDMKAVCF